MRADALKNRELVLEVARKVFATEGLDVPIDEIAKRAGVGVGTIYRHFPNKEALFEAIVIGALDTLLEETKHLHAEEEAEAALVQYLHRYLAAGASKRDFLAALSRTGLGSEVSTIFKKRMKSIRESLSVVLKRAQGAGAIRKDVSVEELIALLHGVSAAMSSYSGPAERRSLLSEVLLDGLRTRRARSRT